MIVLLIILWSLCAVSVTHFLYSRGWKAAATALSVLYCYIIAWFYLIFFFDITDFGYEMSKLASAQGSEVFLSFTATRDALFQLPAGLLIAFIIVSVVIALAAILYLVLSGFRIGKEIVRYVHRIRKSAVEYRIRRRIPKRKNFAPLSAGEKYPPCIHLVHCRWND